MRAQPPRRVCRVPRNGAGVSEPEWKGVVAGEEPRLPVPESLRHDGGTGLAGGTPSSLSILGLWGKLATVGEDRDLPQPGLLPASVSPPITLKKGLS